MAASVLITLTTDFGDSEYVGAMKGVIVAVNPEVRVIDVTHGIRRHSIRHGAYALLTAIPHFPFAVHVAVVDPGVGTDRKALAIACEGAYLVGPDNGLLIPAARRLGLKEVRCIESTALQGLKRSATFHGRDVFAPVAAHLAAGIKFREVGPVTDEWVDLDFGTAVKTPDGLQASVICADGFGNIITNATGDALPPRFLPGTPVRVVVGSRRFDAKAVRTYGDALDGELVVLVGSGGYVELAVNRGSAEDRLRVGEAEEILLQMN